MYRGYVKIYRRLTDKSWYKKSNYIHLWLHILLKCNHKENEFDWNGQTIIVKPGQFITGKPKLSEETGIPESTIERILNRFEREQQIEQQKTNKYRLIAVKNWDKYQSRVEEWTPKRTTDGYPIDTNNNDNNIKEDYTFFSNHSKEVEELIGYFVEKVKKDFGVEPMIGRSKDIPILNRVFKKYKPEKVKKIIDYYLDSDKCEKFGFNLSTALSIDTINRWLFDEEARA